MGTTVTAILTFVIVILWWTQLRRRAQRMGGALVGTFGPQKAPLSPATVQLVVREHVFQERWAFGLAWFSFALGICFGAFLLSRVILDGNFGLKEVAESVAIVGDISLGGGALKLYRQSARQLQDTLKTVFADSSPHGM
jgi:hypothetical protein